MANERKEVIEKLQSVVKKASTNVKIAKKVEAEKGDFKVIVTSSGIEHYYKSQPVTIIKTSELDNDVIDLINSDSEGAAQEILNTFAENFDESSLIKEAANDVIDADTAYTTTEKQLDSKVKLHPRQNKQIHETTDRQISEAGQRPGTYDLTTEAQLRDERSTFYGDPRTSGDWKDENRDTVTEGQLANGDDAATNRGEIGSQFNGGLKDQQNMVGTKQLTELLNHENHERPNTTTEGSDQLGKQDGELSRLTASDANKIIKESLTAMGKTVAALCLVPDKVASIVSKLVSNESKHTPLANLIKEYKGKNVAAIESRVHKARHFGKAANASQSWSDELGADVIVRQLAQISADPKHIVAGLAVLASDNQLSDKISAAFNAVLDASNSSVTKTATSYQDMFKQAMEFEIVADEAGEQDGKFQVQASLEDIDADPSNKEAFANAAFEYAIKQIKVATNKSLELIAGECNVKDDGTFSIMMFDINKEAGKQMLEKQARKDKRREILKNASKSNCKTCGDGSECSCDCGTSEKECSCKKMASSNQVVKEAQMPGGPGGMGSPGAGMGNPAPPPTGGDMNQPPLESFTEEPPAESESGTTGEAKPPGGFCDACGSEDTDVDNGKFRCNNCGAEGEISIHKTITKWPGILENKEEKEGEEMGEEKGIGLGDEGGTEAPKAPGDLGAASNAPSGTTVPNVPVAASIRITPRMHEKLAAQKIELGKVCPNCGSNNTSLSKSASKKYHEGICWDCYQEWNLGFSLNKKTKAVHATAAWLPKSNENCTSCTRMSSLKKDFITSLASYGMDWTEFDALPDLKQQGELILKMASTNTLKINENPEAEIKKFASSTIKGQKKFATFPADSCKERLARRFGENATCMSGPCKGKGLADCVCGQLKNFNTYWDGLAAKVASIHMSDDKEIINPTSACVNMFVKKFNFEVDDACTACKGLKAAYASSEDLIIEKISQFNPMSTAVPAAKPMMGTGMGNAMPAAKPMMDAGTGKPMSDLDTETNEPETNSGSEMSDMGPVDNVEVVEISEPMGGDMSMNEEMNHGNEEFNMEETMGLGGDNVALNLGNAIMEAIKEVLHGGGEQFVDESPLESEDFGGNLDSESESEDLGTGELGDVDITEPSGEEVEVDVHESNPEESTDQGVEDSEIPGLDEEKNEEGLDGLFKHDETKPEEHENNEDHEDNESHEDHESEFEEKKEHETEDEPKDMQAKPCCGNVTASSLDKLLTGMKTGTIGSNAGKSASMDSMLDHLLKHAAKQDDVKKIEYKDAKETKLKDKPAQDSWKEEFSGNNGSTIGHEEKFKAEKPDIARGEAKLEGETITISDSDRPSIPTSSGKLKEEKGIQTPEKQTEVDPNQGGTATVASSSYKVTKAHVLYPKLKEKFASGTKTVKLNNGKNYSIAMNNDTIVLAEISKKAGEKQLNRDPAAVQKDPDIGKVMDDKVHSRSKDEKKPSEGVSEPEVPKSPDAGRLSREHTYDNNLNLPNIPAGDGVTERDTVEKYHPEKQEKIRGQVSNTDSSAAYDEAVKIAGMMLKANKITAEELPSKILQLANAEPNVLNDYKKMLNTYAKTEKGMKKESSLDAVESLVQNPSDTAEDRSELTNKLQSMFRLDRQNRDFENFKEEKGNPNLWR